MTLSTPLDEERERSPQERLKCACPSWTAARECCCLRYAPDDSEPKDEACECSCHEEDYDDGN